MEKDSLLFFFLNFVIQKILDLESIIIPRNFQAKSQKDKLKFVEKARNEKTEIGVRYDLYLYLKKIVWYTWKIFL